MSVITIRMTKGLHAAVRELAFKNRMSMNRYVSRVLLREAGNDARARTIMERHDHRVVK